MDTTSYIALSRQVALERHLTAIANNVANATTSGFRAEHTVFETVLERAGAARRLSFVQDVAQWQDTSAGNVTVTGSGRMTIAPDGTVAVGDEVRGRLQRVTVTNEQALVRQPGGLYRSPAGVAPAGPEVRLVQGALEGSNVEPVIEMTVMMQAQRMFEGTQRLLETQHELERKAIGQLVGARG